MPSPVQPSWPSLLRAYLIWRDPDLLRQTIRLMPDKPELQTILAHWQDEDADIFDQVTAFLESNTDRLSLEERYTLNLILLDDMSEWIILHSTLPLEEQVEALQDGIAATEEATDIAEAFGDVACCAFYCERLSGGHHQLGALEQADAMCRRALSLYKQLSDESPDTYRGVLADTWRGLGQILSDRRMDAEAVQAYRQALTLYAKTGEFGGACHSFDEALTYLGLGESLRQLSRYDEAAAAYQAARSWFSEYAAGGQAEDQFDLGLAWSGLGHVYRDQAHFEDAEVAYRQAIRLFLSIPEDQTDTFHLAERATCFVGIGNVLSDKGRHDEAEQAYRRGLALLEHLVAYRPLAFGRDYALAWNDLGTTLFDQTRYEEAYAANRKALHLLRRIAHQNGASRLTVDNPYAPDLGAILSEGGTILYRLGRIEEATTSYRRALALLWPLTKNNPQSHAKDLVTALNNYATLLLWLGDSKKAERTLKKGLYFLRPFYRTDAAIAGEHALLCANLGIAFGSQDRLHEAEVAHRKALKALRGRYTEHPDTYGPDFARSWLNLSSILDQMGQTAQALESAQTALDIWRQLHARSPEVHDASLASALHNLAVILDTLEQHEEAVAACHEALALRQTLFRKQSDTYRDKLASTWNNLGLSLAHSGSNDRAYEAYQEAARLYEELYQNHPTSFAEYYGGVLNNLGLALQKLGQFSEAEVAFKRAIGMDPERLFDSMAARWSLGALYMAQGRPEDCYLFWKDALNIQEARRGALVHEADRRIRHGSHVPLYGALAQLCLSLSRPDEAWHWTERAKARNFLDQLGSVRPRLKSKAQRKLYQRWKEAEREAAQYFYRAEGRLTLAAVPEGSSAFVVQSWQRKRDDAVRLRKELALSLGANGALMDVHVPPARVLADDLRRLAQNVRALVVQYDFTDEERLTVFLLPTWEVVVDDALPLVVEEISFDPTHVAALRGHFEAALHALARGDLERAQREFAPLPDELGSLFVRPLNAYLNRLHPEMIMIVPGGILYNLPLHAALLTDGCLLCERYPVLYLGSSASARFLVQRRQEETDDARLVLGPPHPTSHPRYRSGSDRETQTLAADWNTRRHAFDAMTTDVLRDHAGRIAVIHLATHSVFDEDDYLQSYLQFHQEHLTIFDIISDTSLDFSGTRLCYLSSCESGISHTGRAQDVQGLVWALMYAGAEAVLASLWPVEDEVSMRMAQRFYSGVGQGLTLVEAYQEAILSLRGERDFANPLFWASFVLFGNGFAALQKPE